jgi:hypothetical protein
VFSLNRAPGKREQRTAGSYLGIEGGQESGTKSHTAKDCLPPNDLQGRLGAM